MKKKIQILDTIGNDFYPENEKSPEKNPETQIVVNVSDNKNLDYGDNDDEAKRRERMLLFNSTDGYLIGSLIHKHNITYEEGEIYIHIYGY
jgi:hypothetical protein